MGTPGTAMGQGEISFRCRIPLPRLRDRNDRRLRPQTVGCVLSADKNSKIDILHQGVIVMSKLISLFLIDGAPDGRITCEVKGWSGLGFKIPRNLFKGSDDSQGLHKPGIYFLFGRDQTTSPETNFVYIGETEDVYKRVTQH